MAKAAYKRKRLIGGWLQLQRVSSRAPRAEAWQQAGTVPAQEFRAFYLI